jgi:hypothetical protein
MLSAAAAVSAAPQGFQESEYPPGSRVRATEFEYFPYEPLPASREPGHVALVRAAIDADGVISSVEGVLPHVPTVAKAFRERLRACDSSSSAFQAELLQLWKVLFRPHDASHPSPLVLTHGAAFEFAINELLLACEERRCTAVGPHASETLDLAPLHFLKKNAAFLEFVSSQLGLAPSVSSVRAALSYFSQICAAALSY